MHPSACSADVDMAPVKVSSSEPEPATLPDAAKVFDLFGISLSRGLRLIDDFLRDTTQAAMPRASRVKASRGRAATKPLSQFMPDASLASLRDFVDTNVLSHVFGLVEKASKGKVICLDAHHMLTMPGSSFCKDGGSMCDSLSTRLMTRHLETPVACTWTSDGHHEMYYVVHSPKPTIYVLDPMQVGNVQLYAAKLKILTDWLGGQFRLASREVPKYEFVCESSHTLQTDRISCGVFVCAYLYFIVFYGRWPTATDLSGSFHMYLRMVIYDMCIRGRLLLPRTETSAGDFELHGFVIIPDSGATGHAQDHMPPDRRGGCA